MDSLTNILKIVTRTQVMEWFDEHNQARACKSKQSKRHKHHSIDKQESINKTRSSKLSEELDQEGAHTIEGHLVREHLDESSQEGIDSGSGYANADDGRQEFGSNLQNDTCGYDDYGGIFGNDDNGTRHEAGIGHGTEDQGGHPDANAALQEESDTFITCW